MIGYDTSAHLMRKERDCDEKVSVREILESVNTRSESNRKLSGGMKVPPN